MLEIIRINSLENHHQHRAMHIDDDFGLLAALLGSNPIDSWQVIAGRAVLYQHKSLWD